MSGEVGALVKQLFRDGKSTNEILKLTGSLLANKVSESFKHITPDFTTPDTEMLARLTRDVWQFSAAKNYQQMRDLTIALKDDKGKLREFADYKEAAGNICAKYNETWLRTEYDSAIASSQNAARWVDFKKDVDSIPNLEYQTVGDSSVRESHQALDGIIRPLKDVFWSTHYPPNGWSCRCEAIQSIVGDVGITKESDIPGIVIPPLFRTNLAETGLIYPKNHPYYNGVPRSEIRKAIAWLPPENTYLDVVIGNHDIKIHPLHGEKELGKNLEACNALLNIDPKAKLRLLPIINEHEIKIKDKFYPKEYIKKFGNKNGDALYNGKVIEFESPNGSKSSIQNAIKEGKKQSDFVILHIPNKIDLNETKRIIEGQLLHYKDKEDLTIWIINSKGDIEKYTTKQKR